jgi:hypothetical protein
METVRKGNNIIPLHLKSVVLRLSEVMQNENVIGILDYRRVIANWLKTIDG